MRCAILSLLLLSPTLVQAETIGTLEMTGDPGFESDSITNSDAGQWRWLSYPGARFSINPAAPGFRVGPMAKELPLDLGGYPGAGVLRLTNVVNVRVADRAAADVNAGLADSVSTTWYPHKLTFQARFAGEATASGCDLMIDADSTVIRVLDVRGPQESDAYLSGRVNGSGGARWDSGSGSVVVSDAKYTYALQFVRLIGDEQAASELGQKAEIRGEAWSLRVPLAGGSVRLGISFGFAAAGDDGEKALARAKRAFAQPVSQTTAQLQAMMNDCLRKVPQPKLWGIEGIKTEGVTPEQHRRAYYAAWAFLIQDTMNPSPANPAYPYPEVGVGKPSLWEGGEKSSPGTCSWESLLGYQWLSYLRPQLTWRAYEGLMSRVDGQGKLGGESLPSRKAQTAWALFRRTGDRARLAKVYPAAKRYLLWREQNLRWIWGTNNNPAERDLEFTVSWLVDVAYAGRIAKALELPGDVKLWEGKQAPAIEQMRAWFFNDPKAIHQFVFIQPDGSAALGERPGGGPIYIDTALCLPELPGDMVARLQSHFRRTHNPDRSNDGYPYSKYPPNSFVALGLVDHGMNEAGPFVQAMLRDSIRLGEFAECMLAGPKQEGVRPSLFTALNIIDFTWLLNGVRCDSGAPLAFEFPR